MTIRYRIKKRPALKARIGGWGNDGRVTREFLAKVGFEVERKAKRNAPVDTGRLRASIGTAWRGRSPEIRSPANVGDGVPQPKEARVVWVGSNVDYALFVHEKHRTHGKFLKRAVEAVRTKLAKMAKSFDSRDT